MVVEDKGAQQKEMWIVDRLSFNTTALWTPVHRFTNQTCFGCPSSLYFYIFYIRIESTFFHKLNELYLGQIYCILIREGSCKIVSTTFFYEVIPQLTLNINAASSTGPLYRLVFKPGFMQWVIITELSSPFARKWPFTLTRFPSFEPCATHSVLFFIHYFYLFCCVFRE